jgi:hypothetical protein
MYVRVCCSLVHDVTKHNILMLFERLWIRLDKFGVCSPMNAVIVQMWVTKYFPYRAWCLMRIRLVVSNDWIS